MNIGNMHKNLVKIVRVVPEISSQTDQQTDILITILCNRSRRRSKSVILLLSYLLIKCTILCCYESVFRVQMLIFTSAMEVMFSPLFVC